MVSQRRVIQFLPEKFLFIPSVRTYHLSLAGNIFLFKLWEREFFSVRHIYSRIVKKWVNHKLSSFMNTLDIGDLMKNIKMFRC